MDLVGVYVLAAWSTNTREWETPKNSDIFLNVFFEIGVQCPVNKTMLSK